MLGVTAQTMRRIVKTPRPGRSLIVGGALAAIVWAANPALAQTSQPPAAPALTLPGTGISEKELKIDFRQTMRRLIEDMSIYAHSLRRDFTIVTRNGLDLLLEADPFDDTKFLLSERYVRSIDGVMIDGLFFGQPKDRRLQFGVESEAEWRDKQLEKLKRADNAGLIGFALDFSTTPKDIDAARRGARKAGLVSYTAPGIGIEMNSLAKWPRRPYGENSRSIRHLGDVKNYVFVRNSGAFGPQSQFASQLAATNYDMILVDVFHKRQEPLSSRTVEALKYKKLGSRRLVFAYLNIGEAANHRYYWKRDWGEGNPAWVGERKRHNRGSYYVRYWDPAWQAILYGPTTSYLYGLIRDLGFDGVLLDGLETYKYYEGYLK